MTNATEDTACFRLRCEKPRIYTADGAVRELQQEVQKPGATTAFVLLVMIVAEPDAALLEPEQKQMELTTRVCGPGDEQALSLLAQATILETYAGITDGGDLIKYVTAELSVTDFARILASDRERAWIAETITGKCPVGYALAVSDEGTKSFSSFELKRLYVFHRFHGHGLGKRLMDDALSFARDMRSEKIWLQVHEVNNHAIEFYKRIGFVQTGTDLFRAGEGSYRVLTLALTLARQI
jgi:ribosomal protein S18 acetylase RimI-like enzyme